MNIPRYITILEQMHPESALHVQQQIQSLPIVKHSQDRCFYCDADLVDGERRGISVPYGSAEARDGWVRAAACQSCARFHKITPSFLSRTSYIIHDGQTDPYISDPLPGTPEWDAHIAAKKNRKILLGVDGTAAFALYGENMQVGQSAFVPVSNDFEKSRNYRQQQACTEALIELRTNFPNLEHVEVELDRSHPNFTCQTCGDSHAGPCYR